MKLTITFLLLALLTGSCQERKYNEQQNKQIGKIINAKRIRIVITDSGTGGLSVMNDIALKLGESGSFKNAELIFVNALFDEKSGYNALSTREEKISKFNTVLEGINSAYSPDLIFVACNTLSVLIDDTHFVTLKKNPPVIGIVEPGVSLIAATLKNNVNSKVIIFGTETTIEEDTHRQALLSMSIDTERIITQACPQLQSFIEEDPKSEETEMLISYYLNEALSNVADPSMQINISLNCSHFGYSEQLWQKSMDETGISGKILNPNEKMADILINDKNRNRYRLSNISMLVVSKVPLVNINPLVLSFSILSPDLAEALVNYQVIEDLF